MNKLLQLEFRRLFRAKSFYICTLISLAMILISAATSKLLYNAITVEMDEETMEAFGAAAIQLPTSFSMMKTVLSSSLTMILAIFVAIFVTEEYSGDIVKNVYSKGYSRDVVYFSKYISSLAAALLIFLTSAIFSFASGKIFFGEIGETGENYVASMFAILFIAIAYHAIYFALSNSLRKTGSSIAISIIGPWVISLLLSLLRALIRKANAESTFDPADYWLSNRTTAMEAANVAGKELLISFLVAGVLIAAGIAIGYFVNRKRES